MHVDCIDNIELSTVSNTFSTVQHSYSGNSTFRSNCRCVNMAKCVSLWVRSKLDGGKSIKCKHQFGKSECEHKREQQQKTTFCILALALLFLFISGILHVKCSTKDYYGFSVALIIKKTIIFDSFQHFAPTQIEMDAHRKNFDNYSDHKNPCRFNNWKILDDIWTNVTRDLSNSMICVIIVNSNKMKYPIIQ